MAVDKARIAILMSGPTRYVGLVTQRLEKLLVGLRFDFFYHLWQEDRTKKRRVGYQSDFHPLACAPRTKVFIVQRPYVAEDYRHTIGLETNSGSPIHATMGMFMGINMLCHVLTQLPDAETFTHVLRIRTDCLLVNPAFVDLLDFSPHIVTMSRNPGLPKVWLSDHLFFCTREAFFRVWRFTGMQSIYDAYRSANRSPERTLVTRFSSNVPRNVRLNKSLLRYRDYQIVYSPAIPDDPEWVRQLVESGRIEELFLDCDRHADLDQSVACFERIASIYEGETDPLSTRSILQQGVNRRLRALPAIARRAKRLLKRGRQGSSTPDCGKE